MPRLPLPPPRTRALASALLAAGTLSLASYAVLRPQTAFADAAPTTASSSSSGKTFPGIPFEPRAAAPPGGAKGPQGEFLDENGQPCSACNSFSAWMKTGGPPKASSASSSSGAAGAQSRASTAAGPAAAAAAAAMAASFGGERTEDELRAMRKDCPPDIEELGRSTWTFLHSLASSLPAAPDGALQTHVVNLLAALPHLYPCPHCRADLARAVAAAGGEAAIREAARSRAGVERWVWERHEEVNRKLGKAGGVPLERVRERWRDGPRDGRCDLAW